MFSKAVKWSRQANFVSSYLCVGETKAFFCELEWRSTLILRRLRSTHRDHTHTVLPEPIEKKIPKKLAQLAPLTHLISAHFAVVVLSFEPGTLHIFFIQLDEYQNTSLYCYEHLIVRCG